MDEPGRRGGGAEPRGSVVALMVAAGGHDCEHDRATLDSFVRTLARLKGYDGAGEHAPARSYPGHVYFMPSETLTREQALALGIHGPGDLFGGVVPHAFVATKAISHPLVEPGAAAPAGWNPEFAHVLGDAVLEGHTAFTREDAHRAGLRVLDAGPVRIKPVRATGGRGQVVARDAAALQAALEHLDAAEIAEAGVVLEEHLQDVRTFSVGQVQVDELVASYWGVQRLTRSNAGEQVYGGSDLTVARGGFETLLALELPPEVGRAVEQARRFDAAVRACFPGFFATRCNYDVALGRDARGRWRSGVLEQSWRVGGATGPELAALEAFRRDPRCLRVHAASLEVFGDSPAPPAAATVHYRGNDPVVGPLTKYTLVDCDVHASEHR